MQGKESTVINQALSQLKLDFENLGEKYKVDFSDEEAKKTKKKLKKVTVENQDSLEKVEQKAKRACDQLFRNYEAASKAYNKVMSFKDVVDLSEVERNKMAQQKNMFENLFKGFKKKYDEQIEKAQQAEKEQEAKRKAVIDQLQERIKTIQSRYEEAGKVKIEKYKQNQTLKHELSKYEPHLVASQSLADAQIKKKGIEIEIQMTTLKQKIEMMDNFKNMRGETQEKLKNSKQNEEKITTKLAKVEVKEEEHKLCLARAHLVFEDYKKAFNVLKDILPKKQKEALLTQQALKKRQQSLAQINKKLSQLDHESETQTKQLQVLVNLEKKLTAELGL